LSRTRARVLASTEDALERASTAAYPLVVSDAYRKSLENRPFDPLRRHGESVVLASAEGANLLCRGCWYDLGLSPARFVVRRCHEYQVCTFLDAWFRPFASIGTRSTANMGQEILLLGPGDAGIADGKRPLAVSPTDLVLLLVHDVSYPDGTTDAQRRLPFALEDRDGRSLLEFNAAVETFDFAGAVERMDPQTYFGRASELLRENAQTARLPDLRDALDLASKHEIEDAVRKSRAAIIDADRSSPLSRGWSMLHRRASRETQLADRAAAVRFGYVCAAPLDILEIATRCDASGDALDGSRSYVMRFERWNEPPANAPWFLHVAPAAASQVNLKRTDPGIIITFSPAPPSGDQNNWIPTQAGPFEVRLILCWPSERALSEMWTPPEIVPTW
jgi:hypothetical protein